VFGISGELEKSKAKVAGADKHNIMLALHTSYILFVRGEILFYSAGNDDEKLKNRSVSLRKSYRIAFHDVSIFLRDIKFLVH